MVIKITPKQSKRINALIKKLCCNYVDSSCLLLYDGGTLACSTSAGTESTAAISKTQSFLQTGSCSPRSCSQAVKRDVKSASHSSYQGQRTSATAQTAPPSKSGRKPPSASAGHGQCSLKQVSGRSPDERYCFATVGVQTVCSLRQGGDLRKKYSAAWNG